MNKILVIILCCSLVPSFAAADDTAIVQSARKQVGVTLSYDRAYSKLAYPNGDIPLERGVCTDVIIRALRDAKNMDLQKLVHEDMKKSFSAYPKDWQLKSTDRNIDHRRVPNLKVYFKRNQESLAVTNKPSDYRSGDIVTSMVSGNLPHIMIVSDKLTAKGVPLVIHNIGSGAREEDSLFEYPLTGHYRLKQL
ncbi:MAG: DUF1287 domain-containing protein [Pseudomonadota bacterium]